MLESLVATIFIASVIIQSFFFLGIFGQLAFYFVKECIDTIRPVSIVVCARNEFSNLQKLLPSLLSQDHPLYEVILVNDRSDDGTAMYLKDMQLVHKNLRVVTIVSVEDNVSPKKNALTAGITAARNEIILLTDADCIPCSAQWIALMTQKIEGKKKSMYWLFSV